MRRLVFAIFIAVCSIISVYAQEDNNDQPRKVVQNYYEQWNDEDNPDMGIFHHKLGDPRERSMRRFSPVLRLAYCGLLKGDISDAQGNSLEGLDGISVDVFLYRRRNMYGSGIDFYLRGVYREWKSESQSQNEPKYSHQAKAASVDCGLRVVFVSAAFWGILWQPYIIAAPRFTRVFEENKPSADSVTQNEKSNTFGVYGGTGLEISVLPVISLFLEVDFGKSSGKGTYLEGVNFDSASIISGVAFRIR